MIFERGRIMVFTESAKLIGPEELKEMLEEESVNPAIERLIFVETKGKEGHPGKVFPMFVEAWAYEDENAKMKQNPKLAFKGVLAYVAGGEFRLVQVMIHDWELNLIKRIWDKPPTKGLREDQPWLEDAEVQ